MYIFNISGFGNLKFGNTVADTRAAQFRALNSEPSGTTAWDVGRNLLRSEVNRWKRQMEEQVNKGTGAPWKGGGRGKSNEARKGEAKGSRRRERERTRLTRMREVHM